MVVFCAGFTCFRLQRYYFHFLSSLLVYVTRSTKNAAVCTDLCYCVNFERDSQNVVGVFVLVCVCVCVRARACYGMHLVL